MKEVLLLMLVEIFGFDGILELGDVFNVVENEVWVWEIIEYC